MIHEITVEEKRSAILPPGEIAIQPSSLMTVIERLASNPNVDIDKIQKLLEMQERWEMNKAKAEFAEAMAEFKKNPPEIIKERTAKVEKDGRHLYSYSYADLENITSAITDGLAERGITHDYKIKQEGSNITVACILKRGIYSTEGVSITAGPDTSGAKNAIQAIASTISYLEKYTLQGATGIAAGMPDTDGNPNVLSSEDREARLKAIKTAPDQESLKKVYLAASKAATDSKDTEALHVFAEAKNVRYKELAKNG